MDTWLLIVLIVAVLILLYLIGGFIICRLVLKKVFGCRGHDPKHPVYLLPIDFPTMERSPYETELNGKKIRGYFYTDKTVEPDKGFIILSHGLFGSHLQYVCDIHYLTKAGYEVLAYDQYGVCESEGESQVSLCQGIRTLDTVICDVENRKLNKNRPIYLYGHSWGGYCCLGVLEKHPEIEKSVCRSGPVDPTHASMHLFNMFSKPMYYFFRPILYPCFYLAQGGRKEGYNVLRALKKNKHTKVLAVYAMDDAMVEYRNSQAYYYKKNPNAQVEVLITEKGLHNSIITEESFGRFMAKVQEYKKIEAITDETEKAQSEKTFMSSLDRASMLEYQDEVKNRVLEFLD